ncbi:Ataxin-7 [Sciurus carolinensis]|uniref:Ataxin-7 n=1 Tax=Sciurus carolinensis TaxID=30640 RepID=A0AA41SX66_SCICA|nr:Ataxin-7 [Sciurus carolinensis]
MDPVCSTQSRQVSSLSLTPSTPSGLSSVSSSPMSRKPQKLKSSKSLRPKESSGNSTDRHNASSSASSGSGKKRKNSSPLLAHTSSWSSSSSSSSSSYSSSSSSSSSSSHSMEYFRKNCVARPVLPYLSVVTSPHSIGLDCVVNKAPAAGLLHEQSGRGPLSGSPTESIKSMSVMVNSRDSTFSLGPFIHQSSELTVNSHSGFPLSHSPMDRLIGKKRKCSLGSGGGGSKPTKVAKLPSIYNVHMKHTSTIPGAQGLKNNSLLHQVGHALWHGPASPGLGGLTCQRVQPHGVMLRGKSQWPVGHNRLLCGTSGAGGRDS